MNNFFDAIGIDLGILVVMLMVLVLVLIVLVLNVSLGLHRQRRRYNMFMKGADGQSLERVFSQKLKEVDRLSRANEQSLEEVRGLKDMLSKSLTKYGIVKYDAFDDVGANMWCFIWRARFLLQRWNILRQCLCEICLDRSGGIIRRNLLIIKV